MLFARFVKTFLKKGQLTIIDADGRTHRCGDPATGPTVAIRLHDPSLHRKLLLNPRLCLGEAYMDGTLTVEHSSIYDFLDLFGRNVGTGTMNALDRWATKARMLWRYPTQFNLLRKARQNAALHYDLSGELYKLFLDSDLQYSCAYFSTPDASLEAAQAAKKRHIAAKLLLKPGQRVLDIGSGWGGLGLYLAEIACVDVTGVTLSFEQHKVSNQWAAERGLSDRVRFHLRDYRQETGRYDRIVSVGAFEHVGLPHYRAFFGKVAELLTDNGVALLHTISHMDPPYPTNPWLEKYIFPSSYTPALSEFLPVIERVGLWVTDVEILRLHYAETLRHWRERFMSNWDKAAALYDERFCRMWEFYLAGCEMVFRRQGHMNAQIQLAKSVDSVPLTRDYIGEWERQQTTAASAPEELHLKSVG